MSVRSRTTSASSSCICCCGVPCGGRGLAATLLRLTAVHAQDVVDPDLKRVVPYLLLISLIGNFIMIQLRKRFIVDYRLPYPSSTVAGIVLNSLHVKGSQRRAVRQARWPPPPELGFSSVLQRCLCQQGWPERKAISASSGVALHVRGACWGDSGGPAAQVKTIWYVSILSFCWSCVRWLFSRADVPFCGGFELMPTFGRAALRQVRQGLRACRLRGCSSALTNHVSKVVLLC